MTVKPTDPMSGLEGAYRALLAQSGLDLAFKDTAPDDWPDVFPGGVFDPRGARQAIRVLESQRRYGSFETVGTEPEADYLYRLAVVGAVDGPYLGDGLPSLQKVLDDQTREIRGWLDARGIDLPYAFFAGVFPTGEFNARARPEPPWGALLLVNSGLMDLIFTVLKTNLASSYGPGDPPLLNESQVVKVLAEAFNAYLFSDSSLRSWGLPPLPDARVGNLGFVLRRAEQFVLAHEVGHVALGHVSINPQSPSAPHTTDMELEADQFAAQLLAVSLRSSPGPVREDEATYVAGGALTFLSLARSIEELQAGLGLEQRDVHSHPDTAGRAAALGAALRRDLPGEGLLRRAQIFSNWMQHFVPEVMTQI